MENYVTQPKQALSLNSYQESCKETAVYTNTNIGGQRATYCALSLAGEAGEVANVVKKAVRDHGFDDCFYYLSKDRKHLNGNVSDAVRDELGDTLWYVAMLAHECGFTLEEIAARNLEKLKERYGK